MNNQDPRKVVDIASEPTTTAGEPTMVPHPKPIPQLPLAGSGAEAMTITDLALLALKRKRPVTGRRRRWTNPALFIELNPYMRDPQFHTLSFFDLSADDWYEVKE